MSKYRFCLLIALIHIAYAASAQEPMVELSYPHGPDSFRQDGVPRGEVSEHVWKDSKVFRGTIRRYYVYVPSQYDATKSAAVMVFQDGHAYITEDGDFRVPVVFDNLIHAGDMPVTIGIFIDPGHQTDTLPAGPGWRPTPANRSLEYDTLSGDYAKFLLSEILPTVGAQYNLTDDADNRAICGISSGGICAFTVAWQRPDSFRKVLSHVGSFTNIRGGDAYPGIIRKTEPKPLRVFLQAGSNDLDNEHGNWPLGNQCMYAALKFKDYDVTLAYGEGAHNGNHGGAILPDSLRWLWRDEEQRDVTSRGSRNIKRPNRDRGDHARPIRRCRFNAPSASVPSWRTEERLAETVAGGARTTMTVPKSRQQNS